MSEEKVLLGEAGGWPHFTNIEGVTMKPQAIHDILDPEHQACAGSHTSCWAPNWLGCR